MPSIARLLPPLLAVAVPVLCDAGPVTIDQGDVYKQQLKCAQRCFVDFDDPGYPIAMDISCPTYRVQNDCFCRPYLQQQAHQFVYTCVSKGCNNMQDVSVATKLYDDYCTSNGFTVTQNTPSQQTDTGALTITITVPPTVVVTTTATATVTVTAAGSSSGRPAIGWVTLAALAVIVMAADVGLLFEYGW